MAAARALLIEQGPQAVTLKAVAARIGRGHANLLHHFGSAAGLQAALAVSMAERITATIGQAVRRTRAGELDPRVIVDLTFDAFGRDGGAALASWMILSGDRAALDPILDAIRRLIEDLGAHEGRPIQAMTLALVQAAMGDAMLGDAMTRTLGLPRETAREVALQQLVAMAVGGTAT